MNNVESNQRNGNPSTTSKNTSTTQSLSSISELKNATGFNSPGVPWSITTCAYNHSKILTESAEETQLSKAHSDHIQNTKNELELGRDSKRLAQHYRRQLAEVEQEKYRKALDYWLTCKSCAKEQPGDNTVSQALETNLRNLTF